MIIATRNKNILPQTIILTIIAVLLLWLVVVLVFATIGLAGIINLINNLDSDSRGLFFILPLPLVIVLYSLFVIVIFTLFTICSVKLVKSIIKLVYFPKNRIIYNNTNLTLYITRKIVETINLKEIINIDKGKFIASIQIDTTRGPFVLQFVQHPNIISQDINDLIFEKTQKHNT